MALHSSVPSTPATDNRLSPKRKLLRPAAALILGALVAFGAVASHAPVTPALGSTSALAGGAGGISPNDGPCWGCGG